MKKFNSLVVCITTVFFLTMLLMNTPVFAQTKANVDVTAELQSLPMTLTVDDIQMTGETGGTEHNGIVEFGSISSLADGKYATAPEVLEIDFDPANNIYNIKVYTSNSNEGYDASKFMNSTETPYWNLGAEANGMIGQTASDHVPALMWSCHDDNENIDLTQASVDATNWTFYKDYYTHMGESANGLLLSTNSSLGLGAKPNAGNVLTTAGRPMETWTWTWEVDWAFPEDNPAHWIQGVDATGYKNIIYGSTSQFYQICTKDVGEDDPVNDKTVYLAVGATFENKPAQDYSTHKLYVEILAE